MQIKIKKKKTYPYTSVFILGVSLLSAALVFSLLLNHTEREVEVALDRPEVVEVQNYFSTKKVLSNPLASTKVQADKVEYGVENILIVGSDSRTASYEGRSDVLIVMQVDMENKAIKLVGVPRDTRVPIAGTGHKDKINHAFAKGIDTSVRTVEDFLDVELSGYIQFNFKTFIDFIDRLGGVEVDSKMAFTEQDSKDKKHRVKVEKGSQTLDGEQALAYARMRKQDIEGDIGRSKRQQEIITSTVLKLTHPSNVSVLTDVLPSIAREVVTSYTPAEMLTRIEHYGMSAWSFESKTVEGQGAMIEGVYYYEPKEVSIDEVQTFLKHTGLTEQATKEVVQPTVDAIHLQ